MCAAASLSEAVTEIAGLYEKASGHKVVLNFGASSTLARQIELGAPCDIFLSADEAKVDALEKRVPVASRIGLLSNHLVVVVPSHARSPVRKPADLLRLKRLALAEPSSVPAGIYAKQWLVKIGLWHQLEPKIIPTENVRGALAAVEAGNADAAIVYRTDVKDDASAYVAAGPSISYPVAVMKNAEQPDAARKFLAFLKSPDAKRLFQAHGFIFHAFKIR